MERAQEKIAMSKCYECEQESDYLFDDSRCKTCTRMTPDEVVGAIKEEVDEKYTKNGEITFNPKTGEYTVWNETYSETVCLTNYPKVAEAALEAYAKHYLG
jgi:hypothetical protein